jgi:hypothetical protein
MGLIVLASLALVFARSQIHQPSLPTIKVDPAAAKAGVNSTWLAKTLEMIQKGEYEISFCPGKGMQAPNRQQNLRLYFTPDSVRLQPRLPGQMEKTTQRKAGVAPALSQPFGHVAPSWSVQWQTQAFGRGHQLTALGSAVLRSSKNRMEYQRKNILEWYENKPEGVEQGFVINNKPAAAAGANGHEEVVIISRPIENIVLKSSVFNQGIELLTRDGAPVLTYSQLKVMDARGRILASRMEIQGRQIMLAYSDQSAVYPVTIDPLFTTASWTGDGGQNGSGYGWSVASAGDINNDGYGDVIIGAYMYDNSHIDAGKVYLYLGSKNGLASTPAWTQEGTMDQENYGYSVASAGDVNGDGYSDVIIGAPHYSNGQNYEGAVFLFFGSSTGLYDSGWSVESNQTDACLGYSVACAGDVNDDGCSDVIVSAPWYNNGYSAAGRVFVYQGSASGLSGSPAWTWDGDRASELFGYSVAGAGDVNGDGYSDVIIGADMYTNGQASEGAAFVFLGSSTGLNTGGWNWKMESNQANADYGYCVASAGDVNGDGYSDIIVGAVNYDSGNGKAFVYWGSSTGVSGAAPWTYEGNAEDFGYSVGSAGDVNGDGYSDIVVGASSYSGGIYAGGKAYVFYGSASGLSLTPSWTVVGKLSWGLLGCSVACAGDVNGDGYSDVIIGAFGSAGQGNPNGQAYIYYGYPSGLTNTASWSAENNQAGSNLGYSVAAAGDVNGDGYGDVIIGAPYFDNGLTDQGRVYIYHGSASGLASSPAWTAESDQAGAAFGYSVACAGDVNGDGFGDVVIGAPYYDGKGRAYAYLGSASGLSNSPVWTAESSQANAAFGYSVACAGDVNGDGFGDVVIGAPNDTHGLAAEGKAYLFHGNVGGVSTNPGWIAAGGQAGANFGYSVANAGDVNRDGFSDVIVGAPNYSNGQTGEGQASVFHGSAASLSLNPDWTAEGNQAGAKFGYSVAGAGDVNGDGFGDVIIGAPGYSNGQFQEGRAFIYNGGSAGLGAAPVWTAESNQANAAFGQCVASAGDVNGDGYSDVIVGVPGYANGQTDEGQVCVYFGSATGASQNPDWTLESNQAGAKLGWAVAGAGDVNGDGYGDVIMAAPYYTNGQTAEGCAWVYEGNGGWSRLNPRPRQVRADGSKLIGPMGAASMATNNLSYRVRLFGRGIQGRTGAKIQIQWAVDTQPLASGTFLKQAAYSDLGITGTDLELIDSNLPSQQAYLWRARLLYPPSKAIFGHLHSPWYRMSLGGLSGNMDFRTGPGAVMPRLLAPASGASTLYHDVTLTARYFYADSNLPAMGEILFQLSTTSNFSSIIQQKQSATWLLDGQNADSLVTGLNSGQYFWRARGVDQNAKSTGVSSSGNFTIAALPTATSTPTVTPTSTPTMVPAAATATSTVIEIPKSFFKIYHSQINPLRGEQARIKWSQPQTGPVTIMIYNLLGDRVVTLVERQSYPEGQYNEVCWSGRGQSGSMAGSGIYIVTFQTNEIQAQGKIAVVK